jgi:hypothetical protein
MDMHVSWSGPHAWPRFESANGLSPLPSHSGVYLLSFEHQDGNILYAAGLTGRPFRERFVEHTREYMASRYKATTRRISSLRRRRPTEARAGTLGGSDHEPPLLRWRASARQGDVPRSQVGGRRADLHPEHLYKQALRLAGTVVDIAKRVELWAIKCVTLVTAELI